MKSLIFAERNFKELIRDPLSWVFCLGFPIIMLIVMSIVNSSIPKEAAMTLFELESLAPAIAIFGLTFIMLFACMLISGDRKDAFLLRIFTSPMKPFDYIAGYILPLIVLSFGQFIITVIASLIMALINGSNLDIGNMLLAMIISFPSMLMLIGFGIIFGTLFNKNAAPGVCSIIISFSGMLGGIWMDVDAMGGGFAKLCKALPFYHSIKAARAAVSGELSTALSETGIISIWAIILIVLAIVVFKKKMRF